MRLMSNNQWKCDKNREAWIERGEDCSAEARVVGLTRAYREIMPDVMALQEVSTHMAELMMADLRTLDVKYEYVSGGDTPLVYRRDKYILRESGFFLYDANIEGLEGSFNNSESKSYAFGVFEDRESGKVFAVMSTHLWWKSSNPASKNYQAHSNEARAFQIKLACARMNEIMAKYSCPGVIMGDFNASINSLCLEAAFADGWKEVHDIAEGRRDETRGHHPCGPSGYSRNEPGEFRSAIDHIIVKNIGEAKVHDFCRLTDEWFDPISDHYPLFVDIDF